MRNELRIPFPWTVTGGRMRPSDTTMIIKRIITWTLAASAAGLLLFYGVAWFRIHQRNSRAVAYRVMCTNNLRELAKSALIYADASGKGFFPFGEGKNPSAHESLNVTVKFYGSAKKLHPKLFICPEWREGEAAEVDEEEKYELDESSLSYTWTRERLSPNKRPVKHQVLASDKRWRTEYYRKSGHIGGVNVVNTDTSVDWIPAAELDPETGLPEGLTR